MAAQAISNADAAARRAFDALNNQELGRAESCIDAALAKAPKHPGLRAARALLLFKQKDFTTARNDALTLDSEKILDPDSINAITHIMQGLCLWPELAACYERVLPQFASDDTSIRENLAMTYIRSRRFPDLQRTCAALFQRHHDVKYLAWGAIANMAQADTLRKALPTGVPLPPNVALLYKLASRTLNDKVLAPGSSLLNAEYATLYLDALAATDSAMEAIAFLTSSRGAHVGVLKDRLEQLFKFYLLARSGRHANAVAWHLWTLDGDCFDYVNMFLDSCLAVSQAADSAPTDRVVRIALENKDAASGCLSLDLPFVTNAEAALDVTRAAFLKEAGAPAGRVCRGVMMAHMEALHRGSHWEELESCLIQYGERAAGKPVFFLDVAKYVRGVFAHRPVAPSDVTVPVSGRGGRAFHSLPASMCRVPTAAAPTTESPSLAAFVTACNAVAVQLLCCAEQENGLTPEVAEELVAQCSALWTTYYPIAEAGGLKAQEESPADLARLVACSVVAAVLHQRGVSKEWLVRGYRLAAESPRRLYHPGLCLFATSFAALLGLYDAAAVDSLDVKAVQRDTMPHFGLWPALRAGHVGKATFALDTARIWYEGTRRECGAIAARVLSHHAPSKLRGLHAFEATIDDSLARVESLSLSVILNVTRFDTVDEMVRSLEHIAPLIQPAVAISGDRSLTDNADRVALWGPYLHLAPGSERFDAVAAMLSVGAYDFPSGNWALRCTSARRIACALLLLFDAQRACKKLAANKGRPPRDAAPPVDRLPYESDAARSAVYDAATADASNPANSFEAFFVAVLRCAVDLARTGYVTDANAATANRAAEALPAADEGSAVDESTWFFLVPTVVVALRFFNGVVHARSWAAHVSRFVKASRRGNEVLASLPSDADGDSMFSSLRSDAAGSFAAWKADVLRDLGVVERRK